MFLDLGMTEGLWVWGYRMYARGMYISMYIRSSLASHIHKKFRNTAAPFSRTSKPFLDSPCLVTHWKIVRNLPDVWQVRLQEDSWFMHAVQKLKPSYDDEDNRIFTIYSHYGKLSRIR